jgi:hypothetical protein
MGEDLDEHSCDIAFILGENRTFKLLSIEEKRELLEKI